MAHQRPSDLDRNVSHAIVGLGVGALVGSKTGWVGFVAGTILSVLLHEALDAPLAQVIADVT